MSSIPLKLKLFVAAANLRTLSNRDNFKCFNLYPEIATITGISQSIILSILINNSFSEINPYARVWSINVDFA